MLKSYTLKKNKVAISKFKNTKSLILIISDRNYAAVKVLTPLPHFLLTVIWWREILLMSFKYLLLKLDVSSLWCLHWLLRTWAGNCRLWVFNKKLFTVKQFETGNAVANFSSRVCQFCFCCYVYLCISRYIILSNHLQIYFEAIFRTEGEKICRCSVLTVCDCFTDDT